MKIKKLEKNQIDDVFELFLEQFGSESWTKQQIADSFNSPSTSFYGIFEDNVLVCVASILNGIDDINLLDIATRQKFKRKGYARAMLSFLLTLKDKTQTMSLEVKSKNTPAINLYQSLGFKTLNIRKHYYKDGDDALCMFYF